MKKARFTCDRCGAPSERLTGDVNRARRNGKPLYCSRECWVPAAAEKKQKNPPKNTPEGRAFKAEYDRRRRERLGEALRAEKRAAYRARVEGDTERLRAEQKALREKRREAHAAYCRRPEYREWKREYDRALRAREYGEFAEAHVALMHLQAEIDSRMSREEIYVANGTAAKWTKRRREYEAAQRI